jgi:hypothetical protein
MSTRSATIIRQTTYWGEDANTEELMRFYRHCDGYPEGHGMELAQAVTCADRAKLGPCYWLATVLEWFMLQSPYSACIEFEPFGCEHGDIEYLYVVEGIVDHRWGKTKDEKLPVTISVYQHSWDEPYISTTLNTEPIFSGTAYEYIEKFGKEQ